MQKICCQDNVIPADEAVRGGNKGTFKTGWTKFLGVLGFT